MRVAILSTMAGVPWGGSEELWADAASEALDAGHEVALFLPRWPELPPRAAALVARGARLHLRRRSYQLGAERAVRRVVGRPVRLPHLPGSSAVRALATFAPDVVIVSEGTLYSFVHVRDVCEWLARSATPYVTVCQHLSDDYVPTDALRARAGAVYSAAYRAAFVARSNVEAAERQIASTLANAIVVRNPVNLHDVRPVGAVRVAPGGPARFASVARLDSRTKGQDLLFAALGDPAWRDREWRLDLFGAGPDGPYLRTLAAHYGIEHRVAFCGQVADVRAIWAEAELLVLASRSEGTPLALVEAMLCARPAVVTDIGGNAEWVTEGETGFVADAPTRRSLLAALERAWAARNGWAAMGARAHAVAAGQYDPHAGRTLLGVALAAASGGRGAPA